MYRGLREYIGIKVSARPNGLNEKTETAIPCRGPGPTRKKKEVYTSSREEEDVATNMCLCGTTIE